MQNICSIPCRRLSPLVMRNICSISCRRLSSSRFTNLLDDWVRLTDFLNASRFKPPFLVDEIGKFVCSNPRLFNSALSTRKVTSLLSIVSGSYHRPSTVDWATFRDTILPSQHLEKLNGALLTLFSHQMAILDDYTLLKYFVRDVNHLQKCIDKDIRKISSFVSLYSGAATECKDDHRQFLSIAEPWVSLYIERLDKIRKEISFTRNFKKALTLGLGGEDFYDSSMWTRTGLYLPFIIVMRKGNYPISIRSNCSKAQIKYSDTISLPDDGKMVVIYPVRDKSYLVEPYGPSGPIKFITRLFRKNGIIPVVINIDNWFARKPQDRVVVLIKEIYKTCDDVDKNLLPLDTPSECPLADSDII